MAEMTAAQAVAWLTDDKALGQKCYSRKQIAALIEQQAQEIAKLNYITEQYSKNGYALADEADKDVARLEAEIAKKDRMVENACDRLSKFRKCPPEVCDLPYHPGDVECCKHWRKWLEKEAEESK